MLTMAENMEMSANHSQELGPAMTALSDQQRAFVYQYAKTGGQNATQAAIAAGYIDNGNGSIRVQAHRLITNPRIKAAFIECGQSLAASHVFASFQRLADEVTDPQSKDGVTAAKFIIQAAGAMAPSESKTVVEHTIDTGDLIEKAKRLSEALGIDPRKLIGRHAAMIDITPHATILSDEELTAL